MIVTLTMNSARSSETSVSNCNSEDLTEQNNGNMKCVGLLAFVLMVITDIALS
jgi:hypothetical protein